MGLRQYGLKNDLNSQRFILKACPEPSQNAFSLNPKGQLQRTNRFLLIKIWKAQASVLIVMTDTLTPARQLISRDFLSGALLM